MARDQRVAGRLLRVTSGRWLNVETFVSWLTTQHGRDDGVGELARHWKEVSPGRVSSVDGVRRQLFREENGEANWANHLRLAVDAYTKDRAKRILGDTPAAQAMIGEPKTKTTISANTSFSSASVPKAGQEWHDPRINALIGRIDALERTVQRLVEANEALLEQLVPVDWDALWEAAKDEIRRELAATAAGG